eukprot:g16608.t1
MPDKNNCPEINGDVHEVKTSMGCTDAREHHMGGDDKSNIWPCWAMPSHSYLVTAWEKALDLTIVATDSSWVYRDGYPFGDWHDVNRDRDLN